MQITANISLIQMQINRAKMLSKNEENCLVRKADGGALHPLKEMKVMSNDRNHYRVLTQHTKYCGSHLDISSLLKNLPPKAKRIRRAAKSKLFCQSYWQKLKVNQSIKDTYCVPIQSIPLHLKL